MAIRIRLQKQRWHRAPSSLKKKERKKEGTSTCTGTGTVPPSCTTGTSKVEKKNKKKVPVSKKYQLLEAQVPKLYEDR